MLEIHQLVVAILDALLEHAVIVGIVELSGRERSTTGVSLGSSNRISATISFNDNGLFTTS
jgi:hypothetical protein